jgi:hypothetical protein
MAGGEVRTLVLTVAIITLLAVGLYMVDPTMCGLVKSTDGFTSSPSTLSAASSGSMVGDKEATAGSTSGQEMVNEMSKNANVMDPDGLAKVINDMNKGSPVPAAAPPSMQGPPNMQGFKNQGFKASAQKQEGFANLEDITGPAEFGSTPSANGCYPRDQLTPGELLPKDGNSTWAQQNPMGTGSLKGKNFLSAGALVGVNTVGQSLRNANQQLRSEPPNPQVPVSVFFNSTIEPDTNRRDMEIN